MKRRSEPVKGKAEAKNRYQTWLLPSCGSGKGGVRMEMSPKLAEEQG